MSRPPAAPGGDAASEGGLRSTNDYQRWQPGQRTVLTWRRQVRFEVAYADRPEPLHDLLRAARAGDADALAEVLDHVRDAASAAWPDVEGAVVVAVPPHLPGPANPLVLAVADVFAVDRGWHHRRDALRRVQRAPEAKTSDARDPSAEAKTLVWVPGRGGTAIVMVDDVVRTGGTLAACLMAIRSAGDHPDVMAIVLAARRGGSAARDLDSAHPLAR